MTTTSGRSSNPFSTRFVRPGAVEYLFPPGEQLSSVVARLAEHGGWGEIVGPHGSGKSTLVRTLAGQLQAEGSRTAVVTLTDGQRRMPRGWRRELARGGHSVVIIDGFEQLSWLSRAVVKAACRLNHWGLIVTAHRSVGFPLIHRTEPSVELTLAVVELLLSRAAPERARRIAPQAVAAALERHGGNVREALFDLYDLYEQGKA